MKVVKKKYFTLLEIMLVIFIIGLIGSALGISMKGSLDEGRAFKTEQGAKQIYDVLTLELAKGGKLDAVLKKPEKYLARSGFIKDPKKLLVDGWGNPYQIEADQSGEDIRVVSNRFYQFQSNKKHMSKREFSGRFPWMVSENIGHEVALEQDLDPDAFEDDE
ncbi:MAG: hypothetical protein S4CHLAM102_07580 [Chlamydiia bacterium]|nr:hypothetical protein [Chlamydiia bacterium]